MNAGDEGLDLTRRTGPPPAAHRRHQILALSGGGYRGLYTAHYLQHVEEHYHLRVQTRFDLIVGTSIGALIGAALATNVPASRIVEKTIAHGPRIFAGTRAIAKLKQHLWKAPYRTSALRDAVVDTLGDARAGTKLSDIETALAIYAVNVTHGRPETFRSYGLAGANASNVPLVDAVLSSAAAPTYFPTYSIGVDTIVDGGIIANAPEMAGLTDAIAHKQWRFEEAYVLAVGTAARRQGSALTAIGAPSSASWLIKRKLFQTTLAAQEAQARSQCEALLGDRYYHVDREPLQEQVDAIRDFDLTSDLATKTLLSLAAESWAEHKSRPAHQRFFQV